MSLNRLKEALRPCSSHNPSASSSSYSQVSSLSSSDLSASAQPAGRKPPKTSLSQQLLRLQDFNNSPLLPKKRSPSPPAGDQLQPLEQGGFGGRKLAQQSKTKRQKQSINDDNNGDSDGDGDEEVGNDDAGPRSRPRLDPSIFEPTGPYEPLVLSPLGDIPLVQVPASINCRLLQHQREGVAFLYRMYNDNHGGVLGDDMGLGKTIQTIAFLAAVFGKDGESLTAGAGKGSQYKDKGPVLIICPSSVIHNWEAEFSKWANFSVSVFHGPNRDLILDKLGSKGVEILITSFDTFRIQGSSLSDVNWEIVVVDEAHRLKNEKSKLYQACMEIKTRKRYGLTGTIMQNKIMELFNLFEWVAPGSLGSREHFRDYYDEPLKHGQRLTAPERFVQVAKERKKHLVDVLRKYLLRRTKDETIGHLMMGKEDNVVFCGMSDLQKRAYRRMLQLPEILSLMNKDLPCSCGSPLSQVECCQRTVPDGIIWRYLHTESPEGCNYCPFCVVLPCLMKLQQISNHLELIKPNPKDDKEKQKKDAEFAAAVLGPDIDLLGGTAQSEDFMGLSDVKHCGKMRALEKLMSSWLSQGDKILVFSHSVRMLDILEKLLIRKGYCFSRLDGSTPTGARQSLVDDFNTSPSKQVFLISTRAGGLGLNLVSANRVVIFDPNWNPAHDLQAQDRSFRFGQRRHVVVFRLLAAGSLEELVYTRQVYKQQLSNIAVSGKMEKRYFEGVQDCKQFQGELFGIHNLFKDLSDKLFTSEIIELHEKQGPESASHGLKQPDAGNLGVHFVSSVDGGESCSHDSENRKLGLGQVARKATVEDLGIVYAHRNEDIVNIGSTVHRNEELATENTVQMNLPTMTNKNKKESEHTSSMPREKKRKHFGLIAQFRGMDEIEFSKWILSSSHDELEEVLQGYKNRRKMRRT